MDSAYFIFSMDSAPARPIHTVNQWLLVLAGARPHVLVSSRGLSDCSVRKRSVEHFVPISLFTTTQMPGRAMLLRGAMATHKSRRGRLHNFLKSQGTFALHLERPPHRELAAKLTRGYYFQAEMRRLRVAAHIPPLVTMLPKMGYCWKGRHGMPALKGHAVAGPPNEEYLLSGLATQRVAHIVRTRRSVVAAATVIADHRIDQRCTHVARRDSAPTLMTVRVRRRAAVETPGPHLSFSELFAESSWAFSFRRCQFARWEAASSRMRSSPARSGTRNADECKMPERLRQRRWNMPFSVAERSVVNLLLGRSEGVQRRSKEIRL